MTIRMKTLRVTATLLVGAIALAGCSSIKDTLGASKYPPDEFMVVAKTPLIIPPQYNLHPPGITNPQPRKIDTSELAMRALFPDPESTEAGISKAEAILLNASGPNIDEPGSRSNTGTFDDVVDKGSLTEDILFDDVTEGSSDAIELRDSIPANPND